MKLVNAKLYQEEIKKKLWERWYDEKYQYYFGGSWRSDFSLNDNNDSYPKRGFAVLNSKDELIGYIGYSVDLEMRVAQWFGAINFTDDKITFGKALYQVIEDCFVKFGMEVVEWCVIRGNPIEHSYDRICKRAGGRIVGIRRKRAKNLAGKVCDDKIYEITREDFFQARNQTDPNEALIHEGQDVWYVNVETNKVDHGTVTHITYINNRVDTITISFEDEPYVETFDASAIDHCFFTSKYKAYDALAECRNGGQDD